ncbi:hypothetical protein [Helicobacter sp. 11S03491-1]|uniref:hypothetical protein n=1 Tax=Helicobacter sp. 11S03491-1 TaxID=1476196 RepID=UPI000BA6C212|nr:hypothetical protein [Helicobacter sp. 11S03491-1]PAF42186.1 hypothetical protein BKH45_04365 [Helicobacter sp. 11S03491-1]
MKKIKLNVNEKKVLKPKNFDLSQFELERFYHSAIKSFFKSYKNSKIYLFYEELRDLLWELQNQDGVIYINQRKKTYQFDITSKTVKNWLAELQKLGFLEFKYKIKDICCIQMKNYENLVILNPPAQKESGETLLPKRFYKDVQLIIKNAIKQYKNKTLLIENEKVIVCDFDKKKELALNQSVYLKIKLADDECFEQKITYEHFIGKPLPSLECNFHQAIIKKRIKEALEHSNNCYEQMQLVS